jgi:hypothetical protein
MEGFPSLPVLRRRAASASARHGWRKTTQGEVFPSDGKMDRINIPYDKTELRQISLKADRSTQKNDQPTHPSSNGPTDDRFEGAKGIANKLLGLDLARKTIRAIKSAM